MVSTGENRTFTSANQSNTKKGELFGGVGGQVVTQVSEKDCRAEATSKGALFSYKMHGLAEVGREFTVTGNSPQAAEIDISGHFKGEASAFGGAKARLRLRAYITNKTTGENIENVDIFELSPYLIGLVSKDEDFTANLDDTFSPGNTYVVGIRVETWATSTTSVAGTADALDDYGSYYGEFPGYANYDEIVLDWV